MNAGIVTLLVALFGGGGSWASLQVWLNLRAKRRELRDKAPAAQIDESIARMRLTADVQDGVLDNLRDALDAQTRRAEGAEQREQALLARLADLETRLGEMSRQLDSAHRELDSIRSQITPRTET